jgi:uncharacterized protein (TIGR03790 family)
MWLIILGIAGLSAAPATAQDATNVLVVVNDASPDSKLIATHYVAARKIPPTNIVHIRTPAVDDIERRRYEFDIEVPILRHITATAAHDRILYIVLTKGTPLRIRGTTGLRGALASVDSELTLLYQKLLGSRVIPAGRLANPYFHGDKPLPDMMPFSHLRHSMYLVTRLDGFTAADVIGLIDRAVAPSRDGVFVLDQRAETKPSNGNVWLEQAAQRLSAGGMSKRVLLESTATVATNHKPVLGYFSWGSNDAAVSHRKFGLGFSPGALAGMFVSTDARTFTEPPSEWGVGKWGDTRTYFHGSPQSLAGDLIREGVTGVSGHVAEPYLDATVRPQILFPAYASGFNLAESYYLAIPYLSWQNLVIGDPLCAPFKTRHLPEDEANPGADAETELPRLFSARRFEVLKGFGVRPQVATLILKASAQLARNDIARAGPSLEEVTRLEPTLNAAHFVLAGLYDRAGEYEKAIERYRAILTTAPDEVRSLNNLAYILAVNKRALADALPLAEKAYRIANNTDVQIDLDLGASLLTGKGTPVGALPFNIDAYDLFAMKAQIADTVGWIYHLLGNDTEAEKYLAEASQGAPRSADVQLHFATVEAAQGRLDSAKTALDRALTLDPSLSGSDEVKALQNRVGKR